LISKITIDEAEPSVETNLTGSSAAERMLKPYGINMLPEKQDAAPNTPQEPNTTV